jgi:hypothetical protein
VAATDADQAEQPSAIAALKASLPYVRDQRQLGLMLGAYTAFTSSR